MSLFLRYKVLKDGYATSAKLTLLLNAEGDCKLKEFRKSLHIRSTEFYELDEI
jgi:hypothetical protein